MTKTAGTWKCRMGVHLWAYNGFLWRGQVTHCLRCKTRKVGS